MFITTQHISFLLKSTQMGTAYYHDYGNTLEIKTRFYVLLC